MYTKYNPLVDGQICHEKPGKSLTQRLLVLAPVKLVVPCIELDTNPGLKNLPWNLDASNQQIIPG